jgi:osmotically-inducible protein OsmY
MYPVKITNIRPDEYSRCKERGQIKNSESIKKSDTVIKQLVYHALWADDVLRSLDYPEIDVFVKDGVVHLYGHIVSTNSQWRVQRAIQTVAGVLAVKDNLVMDDTLTVEVASSLGMMEHTYHCKFFTGASHGVISLNGNVTSQRIKLLAAKRVAAHPSVRGVINNIHASGAETGSNDRIFLQPTLGENIYFLDGVSGIVKQVIIDPNDRLVVAMTVLGKFNSQAQRGGETVSERLIVLRMSAVRYLTRDSGFLYIRSDQKDHYADFDPAGFVIPNKEWIPPYPYCTEDVLFPVASRDSDVQVDDGADRFPFADVPDDTSFKAQFYSHDSLGA